MAELKPIRLIMPGSGWDTVKKIIRAYYAVQDEDSPKVDDVAKLAGVQRPIISLNNNFLRDVGFLLETENKLTPIGARYATGLGFGNESLSTDALQELIRNHAALSYIVNMLKARGEMKPEAMRGEMIVLAGLSDSSKAGNLKTFMDMLQDAKIYDVVGDMVVYKGGNGSPRITVKEGKTPKPIIERVPLIEGRILPIPLGIGRLVNIELPEDWTAKDLPKLLKMLELSLGDGESS
jgi:hypothetical protein